MLIILFFDSGNCRSSESQNHTAMSQKPNPYTRAYHDTPSYFKNPVTRDPQGTSYVTSYHENGIGYVPYSPYSLRRREINRALSASNDDPNANLRSASPFRQFHEQDLSFNRHLTNGRLDDTSHSSRYSLRDMWLRIKRYFTCFSIGNCF